MGLALNPRRTRTPTPQEYDFDTVDSHAPESSDSSLSELHGARRRYCRSRP